MWSELIRWKENRSLSWFNCFPHWLTNYPVLSVRWDRFNSYRSNDIVHSTTINLCPPKNKTTFLYKFVHSNWSIALKANQCNVCLRPLRRNVLSWPQLPSFYIHLRNTVTIQDTFYVLFLFILEQKRLTLGFLSFLLSSNIALVIDGSSATNTNTSFVLSAAAAAASLSPNAVNCVDTTTTPIQLFSFSLFHSCGLTGSLTLFLFLRRSLPSSLQVF